ncbi:hypothetical protein MMC28_007614 [Mycoblastus sanguinarius]|nr:hypothetical protein [Mycoblastus sanguinarius]
MTGSRPQWYNGLALLSSFFCCRLLWGTYQSVRVYQDVWAGLHYDSSTRAKPVYLGAEDEIMRFSGDCVVPNWLACIYLGSNIVLNTLNFYWFGKMIETVKKRFKEPKDKQAGLEKSANGVLVEGLIDSSTIITEVDDGEVMDGSDIIVDGEIYGTAKVGNGFVGGKNVLEVEKTEVRRRKG